jgi:two-component system, NtrC family, response regulator
MGNGDKKEIKRRQNSYGAGMKRRREVNYYSSYPIRDQCQEDVMKRDLSKFGIIGASVVMQELYEWVYAAAPHWDTILITGERGTGKELLAKAIHRLGPTRGREPVIVDCAALHPATVEAALFGHERGAFTGAVNKKIGFLESAHDGAVFFDEIGALPLETQGRFLRFLEERTITRIGASSPIRIRARIIAATNRNIMSDSYTGLFLSDLYDRLSVLHVQTPPLRERRGDISLLLQHFLGKDYFSRLTNDALQTLDEYSFPGNVRELRNICRRLVVFHPKEQIYNQHLIPLMPQPAAVEETNSLCSQ